MCLYVCFLYQFPTFPYIIHICRNAILNITHCSHYRNKLFPVISIQNSMTRYARTLFNCGNIHVSIVLTWRCPAHNNIFKFVGRTIFVSVILIKNISLKSFKSSTVTVCHSFKLKETFICLRYRQALPFCIISVDGGDKDNAIPVDSKAEIVVSDEDIDEIQSLAAAFQEKVRSEFHVCDPVIAIDADVRAEGGYEVFSMALTEKVIFMLMQVPNGIQTMSADLPGLVESSLNLGVLETTEEGVAMTWAIRSSVKSLKELMKDKLRYMTEFLGGEMTFRGEYPEWPFNPDSKICALCKKIYEEQTGEEASIEMIHAGLECGLLSEKMPWLDMVSMGPEMHDIHTSRERLGIASVERTYNLVLTVLKEFKNYCN